LSIAPNGGFYESSLQARLPPRQPAHALSRGDAGLVRGHRRACLPRSRPDRGGAVHKSVFFDPESWSVTEHFERDWSVRKDKPARVEPGHHYEWVWLLLRQARFADQPELKEYCRKLYATSHAFGHARGTDAVCDSMAPDGSAMLGTARLWCQTEALKAGLLARADGLPGDETLFIRMLDVIFNRYLTHRRRAAGTTRSTPTDG
jgi:hypothetical protein